MRASDRVSPRKLVKALWGVWGAVGGGRWVLTWHTGGLGVDLQNYMNQAWWRTPGIPARGRRTGS